MVAALAKVGYFVGYARRRSEPLSLIRMRSGVGTYELLRKRCRSSDPAIKIAEDEVLVICPGTGERGAELTARRLAGFLGAQTMAGVATLGPVDGADELIERTAKTLAVLECQPHRTDSVLTFDQLSAEDLADVGRWSELKPARDAAVTMASAMLTVKDSYTGEHSDDVVVLAGSVARRLGLRPSLVDWVEIAGRLHDVGKVGVDRHILCKPGPLDDHEWDTIRQHTLVGERIVCSVPALSDLAPIVKHEHEHWDGGGYPDGLAGESIPLASRIVLACDAYHAMRSDRPYRRAMSHETAVAELRAHAGTQFDPQVVEALVTVVEEARDAAPAVGDARSWRLTSIALGDSLEAEAPARVAAPAPWEGRA